MSLFNFWNIFIDKMCTIQIRLKIVIHSPWWLIDWVLCTFRANISIDFFAMHKLKKIHGMQTNYSSNPFVVCVCVIKSSLTYIITFADNVIVRCIQLKGSFSFQKFIWYSKSGGETNEFSEIVWVTFMSKWIDNGFYTCIIWKSILHCLCFISSLSFRRYKSFSLKLLLKATSAMVFQTRSHTNVDQSR